MLKAMRKNMKAVLWVLLASFVLWGGSSAVLSSRSKTANYAGAAFGKNSADVAFATWQGDPQAAFGGSLIVTFPFTTQIVEALTKAKVDA